MLKTNTLASSKAPLSPSVRAEGDRKYAKCQYASPGTYGHECGAPATSVLVTVMPEDVKQALLCMGAKPSADGLSRAGRCDTHRDLRESGRFVRSEEVAA